MNRYYLWSYSKSYGWQAHGRLTGYETLQELKDDCEFHMQDHPYQILQASTIEYKEETK